MSGRLLLVPNTLDLGAADATLEDVLPHGVLRMAAGLLHWVAEDARNARAFLKRVGAVVPLAHPLQELQVNELPRPRKGSREDIPPSAWATLLEPARRRQDIGLLSEAGLPGVADPGAALVQAAHDAAIPVWPLAGASSLTLALAASGLNGQSFAFVGYLPQDAAARAARLRDLEALSRRLVQTQLLIETPYRNATLAAALWAVLAPGTRVSIACGMTQPSGWCRTATVAQWRKSPPVMPDTLPAVFALLAA